jgi:RNA polymerase sigma-70 factor (ECF subfamily)
MIIQAGGTGQTDLFKGVGTMLDLLERETPPVSIETVNTSLNDTSLPVAEDFEAGILAHLESLSRTARRLTNNPQDAEDLVQDVMVLALRFSATYQRGTNLKAWLFRILTTTSINRYRKQARQPISISFPDGEAPSFLSEIGRLHEQDCLPGAEDEVISKYLDEEVALALTKLSPTFRQVILMADIGELTYKEIANALHIPMGTVMSRISRGRRILHQYLLEYAQGQGYVA